ncbi:Dopey, N-terminal family protein [Cryptosporidium meleagridis]|uniref:Dopey, N-terminal family protein n=1 Tax=Cryptosporidium meleagridis TaxID=93969 RepID=A0A2P4Z5G9_9CRYT|nr:Dopey, N-terminal family protein [Cryptosporidium meleagridis]
MSDFSWPKSDFRKYENEIHSILQSFEKAQEWADLSNCLQRLSRCINKEFCDIPGVPLKETISKRLAQCLNPSLPSGVHTKALETYGGIFGKIGKNELSSDLALYGSGLFPFFVHSSTQVKPIFLDLIDQYFLPLGPGLLPCLSGLIVGLLPGLEDSKSECYDRIMKTFQSISSRNCVGEKNFMCTLWLVILRTTQVRYPALEVILARFSTISISNKIISKQKIQSLIPCSILFLKALESCIEDENVLVKRYILDFLISYVPINQRTSLKLDYSHIEEILPHKSKVNLLRKALKLFLIREWSLTRRLIQWIMNDKYFSPEKRNEYKMDNEIVQILIAAIIEELIFSFSLLDNYFSVSENSSSFAKYQSIRISKNPISLQQTNNLAYQTTILQPIKMINALFEEFVQCINFIAPKILIPIFIYSRESTIKVPELKDSLIEECKSLINSSNLSPNIFLDTINSTFLDLLKKKTGRVIIDQNESFVTSPTSSLLKEIILFYVDNFLLNQEAENNSLESFFIDLFIILIKIMVEFKAEDGEMIVFTELCIFSLNNLKAYEEINKNETLESSIETLKQFIRFISTFLYENVFTEDKITLRNLLYEALTKLFNIKIFNEILLGQMDMSNLSPFEKFPIPSWLYKLFSRLIEMDFAEYSLLKLENYHIEDFFKCLKIVINLLFNSNLFSREEFIPSCWAECTIKIVKMLWGFLNSDLFRFHEPTTNLLIDLENWAQVNFSRISNNININNQALVIRGSSILNQLFISQLSVLDIDLRIKNIKKLSIFMKYSVNSIYKIPPEVTFLILEGLDSNFIQLKSSCSIWITQAMETPKLILDHLLGDLSGFEFVFLTNKRLQYKDGLDFARIIYSLERLVALISMENINIIQVLFDTKIDKSISFNIFQYEILNYFEAFTFICLALFIADIPNSSDLRVNCTAINSLNFILNKTSNNYVVSKKFNYENKLMAILHNIINLVLDALQESITTKKYPLQAPTIQLLNTILLIQRQYKSINNELEISSLISTNTKLFTILISGIQQTPNLSDDQQIEINKNDYYIFSTNYSSISLCSSLIKPYLDLSLSIFEDLDQETLIQNAKSIISCLCMELIVSISNENFSAILQYLDSILKVILNIIGIFPVSNTLSESRPNNFQNNSGFIYSLFSSQKSSYQNKNRNIELNSLAAIPQLLNNTPETISSITQISKSLILKNTVLILFSALIEAVSFVHENRLSKETANLDMVCSQILRYVDSVAFIIAWNASDAFVFSGIACWSHVNNQIIKKKSRNPLNQENTSNDIRNISIISIFQLNSIKELIGPATIFSVVGDFLSYFWLNSNVISTPNNTRFSHSNEAQDAKIPSYVLFFSKITIDKDWIYCHKLWKETMIYHFLYTVLVTYPFSNGQDEFLNLWEIISTLLNLFLQNVKQPKSILWFATILSTLDSSMSASKDVPSSFFLDKRLLCIFEDKKMIRNLNNLIYMVLFLLQENFSSKVSGAALPQQFDKFPPLPPNIEAILQSIEFDFSHESQLPPEISNIQGNSPKSIVSDDPSLLFSYYSLGFLIMYNTEVAFHANNKRLFLRNIWGSCMVKSLDWMFQPLLKRNNNVANMIHKYFLLLHIDTFPFRIFPDYLSGIRKPVIEALNSPNFFCIDRRTFRCWTNIISKLVSYDSTSLSAVGRVNILETYVSLQSMGIFSTKAAELQNRCNHIKRLAFLIFCCPQNTFQLQLSLILEKLVENLKLAPEYLIDSDSNISLHFVYLAEQVILCLRVLLLKVHYQSLMPLWPIVLAELIKIFRLKNHKRLKISAMKFVDLASLLDIPEFHLYQWIFVIDFFNTKNTTETDDQKYSENTLSPESILFSPFCNISDANEDSNKLVLGIDMKALDRSFNTEIPKFPLIHQRNKTESNDNFVEMALQLNNNCLLNSIKGSKIDYEKLLRSIENDFLDFPDNLLDWSYSCDLYSLYNMILNQKSILKQNCNEFSKI